MSSFAEKKRRVTATRMRTKKRVKESGAVAEEVNAGLRKRLTLYKNERPTAGTTWAKGGNAATGGGGSVAATAAGASGSILASISAATSGSHAFSTGSSASACPDPAGSCNLEEKAERKGRINFGGTASSGSAMPAVHHVLGVATPAERDAAFVRIAKGMRHAGGRQAQVVLVFVKDKKAGKLLAASLGTNSVTRKTCKSGTAHFDESWGGSGRSGGGGLGKTHVIKGVMVVGKGIETDVEEVMDDVKSGKLHTVVAVEDSSIEFFAEMMSNAIAAKKIAAVIGGCPASMDAYARRSQLARGTRRAACGDDGVWVGGGGGGVGVESAKKAKKKAKKRKKGQAGAAGGGGGRGGSVESEEVGPLSVSVLLESQVSKGVGSVLIAQADAVGGSIDQSQTDSAVAVAVAAATAAGEEEGGKGKGKVAATGKGKEKGARGGKGASSDDLALLRGMS